MKTLRESLFDDDLVEKDLKFDVFGDLYTPYYIRVSYGWKDGIKTKDAYYRIMSIFDYNKLKRDVKPIDMSKILKGNTLEYADELQYILTLISNILVSKSDQKKWMMYDSILHDEIEKVLNKYKNKSEWSRKRAWVAMYINSNDLPYLKINCENPNTYIQIDYKKK